MANKKRKKRSKKTSKKAWLEKDKKQEKKQEQIKIDPTNAEQWLNYLNPNWSKEVKFKEDGTCNTDTYKNVLLKTMLSHAVPTWHDQLKCCTLQYIKAEQKRIAREVGEKGDVLLYGSKNKGEASKIFQDFSKGITILAMLSPDGVNCFGHYNLPCPSHWESEQETYKHDFSF